MLASREAANRLANFKKARRARKAQKQKDDAFLVEETLFQFGLKPFSPQQWGSKMQPLRRPTQTYDSIRPLVRALKRLGLPALRKHGNAFEGYEYQLNVTRKQILETTHGVLGSPLLDGDPEE